MREFEAASGAGVVVFGPKTFGENVNPFARVPMRARGGAYAQVGAATVRLNQALARTVGESRYVDLIDLLGPDGRRVRFFDDAGNPLAIDRTHLTRYGALYAADRLKGAAAPAFRAIRDAKRATSP